MNTCNNTAKPCKWDTGCVQVHEDDKLWESDEAMMNQWVALSSVRAPRASSQLLIFNGCIIFPCFTVVDWSIATKKSLDRKSFQLVPLTLTQTLRVAAQSTLQTQAEPGRCNAWSLFVATACWSCCVKSHGLSRVAGRAECIATRHWYNSWIVFWSSWIEANLECTASCSRCEKPPHSLTDLWCNLN